MKRLSLIGVFALLLNPGNVARIEQGLKKGGNRDVTTKIFPGAEHDLNVKGSNY